MASVKGRERQQKARRRLPKGCKARLAKAGITQAAVVRATPDYHPKGWEITPPFVNRILNGKCACPAWFREMVKELLKKPTRR